MSERWRFVDDAIRDPARRVIEVEAEPTSGFLIPSGKSWDGLHVKARYPLLRDRRWKRANIVGDYGPSLREAAEAAARELLRPTERPRR